MLTELQAINIILRGIGQSPVTSAGLQHPHAIAAKGTFDVLNEEVQAKGWWFNEDTALNVLPNDAGEITLPVNVLSADPTRKNSAPTSSSYPTSHLVQRGTRMYDPVNNTFVIDTPVELDITFKLDFADLPYAAQLYIAYYASAEMHSDTIGDSDKLTRLGQKVFTLLTALKTEDIINRGTNAQSSSGASRLLSGVQPAQRR